MKAEDVPADLVEKAAEAAFLDRWPTKVTGYTWDMADEIPQDMYRSQARAALAAVLPEVAKGVRDLGRAMREADGWDEEWSTREVRDALNIAADRIDRKGWS